MKINWKGNLIALGIVGTVIGGSYYVNHISNDNSFDPSYITAKADITADNSQDNTIANDKSNDITVAPYDGTDNIKIVDTNNDSPFVNDDYMQDKPKLDPQIGDTVSDVNNSTWGRAGDITTTKTAYGESQLWIYQDGRSLFFQDGILESITQ